MRYTCYLCKNEHSTAKKEWNEGGRIVENINRHGDVCLTRVSNLPEDAILQKGKKILAEGEVSFHAHRIDVGELFETKDGRLYLKVDELASLSHEEHETRTIEPGIYLVGIKRQYRPDGGWSKVVD